MSRPTARVLSARSRRSSAPSPVPDGGLLADRLLFSIDDVAYAAHISGRYVRMLVAAGHLKAVRLGRRCLIPKEALERLIRDGAPPTGEVS